MRSAVRHRQPHTSCISEILQRPEIKKTVIIIVTMGQALYRKYRSKSLDEIVGQEHITTTLKKALEADRLSHAYLFTGPRGVGKTSIARILAHEINGLPYTDDSNHLDIIEIDAASNRRIDEIRDLRDKVYIAPAQAKYKVYIIDEVHMLTKEAFNALLKTLEEPPAHVIFILATTEVHKLPATIISRTQRYVFRPVEHDKVTQHLRSIADQEKIAVSDEALALIAQHGEGSFRDSISLLDQAGNYGQEVTLDIIRDMLGVVPSEAVTELIGHISAGEALPAVAALTALTERGYPPAQLAAQIGAQLRADYLAGQTTLPPAVVLDLLASLVEVPASADPERLLEIRLLAAIPAQAMPVAPRPKQTQVATPAISTPVSPPPKPKPVTAPAKPAAEPAVEDEPVAHGGDTFDINAWPQVLEAARQQYNTLYSILKSAQPIIEDNQLRLCVKFPFHQKRLNEAKNRQIIGDVIKSATGLSVSFECIVAPKEEKPAPEPESAPEPVPADPLSAVNDIFGGGEVLK
ncbi:MAG: dnaX [Candidatus Saccharibacteria bacterium]|nr:dnaX [Candidatus Saccharibacteria bacterium]